ncbi:OsmC-like protein [Rubripirellula lacrimiformis]|uniref:OsmC-like protein n=1 Tax=Rubripirellula lacrimiformis TaxID=1930273 RepID=A0A517NCX7_9BACT|nr:OsmC family protein [Rubripirellula lacrimiformis]QDT04982.1 OsmC-like protein [Rubripirellula lacrimiformis]
MIHATVHWTNHADDFDKHRYSRAHTWMFDGGLQVPASSSPDIVAVPMSDSSAVDPEEAFVASLSSCHMLWFLSIAAKAGFALQDYRDQAVGEMKSNDDGKLSIAIVTLHPVITWSGTTVPTANEVHQMHRQAHEECFIANSVKTEVRIES